MSKLTVTLPDDLHAQIRQELVEQGITTGQFIAMAVTKYFTKSKEGANDMANRTIAFQVSEELYQRIKDYLKHYEETYGEKLTQKDFMVQLIEAELDAADEEAEAAAAQEQDPSAEMNDPVGEDPAEDPAGSDDEDEPMSIRRATTPMRTPTRRPTPRKPPKKPQMTTPNTMKAAIPTQKNNHNNQPRRSAACGAFFISP